jgi:DNA polymerase-1
MAGFGRHSGDSSEPDRSLLSLVAVIQRQLLGQPPAIELRGVFPAAVRSQADADRQVRTLSGRRRWLPGIQSGDSALASEARRQAVNTIIQGTAADLMKLALIRLHDRLPDDVKMLLPVHDSVLLEVPLGLVEETRRIVVEGMEETPADFRVPLKIAVRTGNTWAECR